MLLETQFICGIIKNQQYGCKPGYVTNGTLAPLAACHLSLCNVATAV